MLNFLLKTCVCVSIACHSAIVLPNIDNFDIQEVIKSEFDVNLRQLKKNYLEKINQLKKEATNSTINGINFDVTEKLEVTIANAFLSKNQNTILVSNIFHFWFNMFLFPQFLNKAFQDQAREMKNLHKQSLAIFDRRYHMRCIDCISDYFEELFGDFCNVLDEGED